MNGDSRATWFETREDALLTMRIANHELRRVARNENLRPSLRQTDPTGKSPKSCPARFAKIFRLTRRANQCFFYARLSADEGRVAIVTNVRWDAVDAAASGACVVAGRAWACERSNGAQTTGA
jgi:hypothetical protein